MDKNNNSSKDISIDKESTHKREGVREEQPNKEHSESKRRHKRRDSKSGVQVKMEEHVKHEFDSEGDRDRDSKHAENEESDSRDHSRYKGKHKHRNKKDTSRKRRYDKYEKNDSRDRERERERDEDEHHHKKVFHNVDGSPVEKSSRLFVANCDYRSTEVDVASFFEACDGFKEFHFLKQDREGHCGFGFANFDTVENAQAAKLKVRGQRLLGREFAIRSASISTGPRSEQPRRKWRYNDDYSGDKRLRLNSPDHEERDKTQEDWEKDKYGRAERDKDNEDRDQDLDKDISNKSKSRDRDSDRHRERDRDERGIGRERKDRERDSRKFEDSDVILLDEDEKEKETEDKKKKKKKKRKEAEKENKTLKEIKPERDNMEVTAPLEAKVVEASDDRVGEPQSTNSESKNSDKQGDQRKRADETDKRDDKTDKREKVTRKERKGNSTSPMEKKSAGLLPPPYPLPSIFPTPRSILRYPPPQVPQPQAFPVHSPPQAFPVHSPLIPHYHPMRHSYQSLKLPTRHAPIFKQPPTFLSSPPTSQPVTAISVSLLVNTKPLAKPIPPQLASTTAPISLVMTAPLSPMAVDFVPSHTIFNSTENDVSMELTPTYESPPHHSDDAPNSPESTTYSDPTLTTQSFGEALSSSCFPPSDLALSAPLLADPLSSPVPSSEEPEEQMTPLEKRIQRILREQEARHAAAYALLEQKLNQIGQRSDNSPQQDKLESGLHNFPTLEAVAAYNKTGSLEQDVVDSSSYRANSALFSYLKTLAEDQENGIWTGTLTKDGQNVCSLQAFALSDTGSNPHDLSNVLDIHFTARLGSWKKSCLNSVNIILAPAQIQDVRKLQSIIDYLRKKDAAGVVVTETARIYLFTPHADYPLLGSMLSPPTYDYMCALFACIRLN